MQFTRALIMAISSLIISKVSAAELGAKLNTQIELLPSCSINNKPIADGTTNINLGEINFGDVNASFNNTIEAVLMGDAGAGIQIRCSGSSVVKLIFGSGQNDGKVPTSFAGNYYHALTNGADYLAYNLLYGVDQAVIKPNDSFVLNNVDQNQVIQVFGRVINNGTRVSMGNYSDVIPVTIEF
jgi:spore coat protein U-like protein